MPADGGDGRAPGWRARGWPRPGRRGPWQLARAGRGAVRAVAGNSALVGLLALATVMSVASPVFLTPQNLLNVGEQAAVVAVLAVGVTFVIVTGGIDLSVGSVLALSGIVAGVVATELGLPGLVGVAAALLAGAAVGAVNGVLVAYAGFPAFVATLVMLSVARGLTLVLSDGGPISMPPAVRALGLDLGPVPVPLLVPLVLGAAAAFLLGRTRYGRWMYAIGGNRSAAERLGLPVRRVTLSAYVVSGTCAALAGLILAGRLSSAQPQSGVGDELDAISAVVIGGASLSGGYGTISGTLTGALLLAVIRNSLNLLAVSSFWQQVAIGVVVALAVGIDQLRRRRR